MIKNEVSEAKVSNNARIDSRKKRQSSMTEAWANQAEMTAEANVSIPSDSAMMDAKDWVDNGSKL